MNEALPKEMKQIDEERQKMAEKLLDLSGELIQLCVIACR